jgi:hypothetical protein
MAAVRAFAHLSRMRFLSSDFLLVASKWGIPYICTPRFFLLRPGKGGGGVVEVGVAQGFDFAHSPPPPCEQHKSLGLAFDFGLDPSVFFGFERARRGGDSTGTASYLLAEMAAVPSQISAECVFDKAIYF